MQDNPWKSLASRTVYENNWIKVDHEDVINPNGNEGIYGVVHFKNLAIGVIPLDDEMNTWIVGQYRYPLKRYSWEIPEGGGPHDRDPLESAKRELLEECGIVAERWERFLEIDLSNSATDEQSIVFLARGLSHTASEPEDTEQLHVRKVPFATLYDMVMQAEVTDAISVAAVLKLKVMMDSGMMK